MLNGSQNSPPKRLSGRRGSTLSCMGGLFRVARAASTTRPAPTPAIASLRFPRNFLLQPGLPESILLYAVPLLRGDGERHHVSGICELRRVLRQLTSQTGMR
jgi:hypothetical protein